jgi:hypothetical protein
VDDLVQGIVPAVLVLGDPGQKLSNRFGVLEAIPGRGRPSGIDADGQRIVEGDV